MSRLDSFIRRMSAQRDCLNMAAQELATLSGPVLEFGLGNGRTYDHLRNLFDPSDIYVFERQVNAHLDCIPDEDHLILGDVLSTLPKALPQIGQAAKLAHCDIGTGDKAASMALVKKMGASLDALLQSGAFIVSDQSFDVVGWSAWPLPETVAPGRYYMYRKD